MNIDIEFFSEDALENIATCLDYNMDKIIFMGYSEPMNTARVRNLSGLIKNVIGINEIDFVEVEKQDLAYMVACLEDIISRERALGNTCYIDLTGGDNLIFVAAGIVAVRLGVSMHQIDISDGTLYEYTLDKKLDSIYDIRKDKLLLSLSDYMKFRGTCINQRMHKNFKSQFDNKEFTTDIYKIWEVCRKFGKHWNVYGKYFRSNTDTAIDTMCTIPFFQNDDIDMVHKLLKELKNAGALTKLYRYKKFFKFKYKNEYIKDCLCDSGSILELYTYLSAMETDFFDECSIGIHLDWDGSTDGWLPDVTNEIDVLLIKNNIPTFISCKNGRLDKNALYELDTVSKKFGGKYAKRVIISSQNHDDTIDERGREMGIILVNSEIFDWTKEEFQQFLISLYTSFDMYL